MTTGFSNALAPTTFGNLDVNIGQAKFFINNTTYLVPESVVFLEPAAVNYVYYNFSGGTVGVNQQGYPPGELPICIAVTDNEKVISLVDQRPDFTDGIPSTITPHFSDAEAPTGAINGTNVTFEVQNSCNPPASLILMLNGVVQTAGVDYTLVSQTITFVNPPVTGDTLLAWYRY